MNEERNPYTMPYADEPAPQQPPQDPYRQPYPQQQQPPQQPYYPLQQQAPQQYQQPYYPPQYTQQPYYRQPYANRRAVEPGRGAAKVFSIISFAVGCFSLLMTLSLLLQNGIVDYSGADRLMSDVASSAFSSALFLAVPGLVFGILAIAKKTKLFPMALLGVIFNGIMLLNLVFTALSRL